MRNLCLKYEQICLLFLRQYIYSWIYIFIPGNGRERLTSVRAFSVPIDTPWVYRILRGRQGLTPDSWSRISSLCEIHQPSPLPPNHLISFLASSWYILNYHGAKRKLWKSQMPAATDIPRDRFICFVLPTSWNWEANALPSLVLNCMFIPYPLCYITWYPLPSIWYSPLMGRRRIPARQTQDKWVSLPKPGEF